MNIRISILLVTVLLSACDSKQEQKSEVVIYNADVAEAVSQYKTTLKLKRTEVIFENSVKANNCESYIKAIKSSRINEGVNNQLVKSEYLICDALLLVGDTKYTTSKSNSDLGKSLSQRLDLRSFPSSRFQMLDEKMHTLDKLTGDLKVGANSASVESKDWHYALELVAVTDVNKNGKADWIVWLIDEAKMGNYRGYQTLVAYDVDKSKGLIKLQPFPN